MLDQATKDRLKALGIDADKLTEAVKADAETAFALPEGSLLTDAQLTERDGIKVKEGEKAGETAAKTALIKEAATKAGLTIQGDRMSDLVTAIKEGLGKDKDTAFKALQEQNTALLADKETMSGKVTAAEQALKTGMFEVGILSQLPANGMGLSPKETLELLKIRGIVPEKTDTGIAWKQNGQTIKDGTTHAPLVGEKAINHIWTEQKFTATPQAPQGGRGGSDGNPSAGTGLGSYSAVAAKWKQDNPGKNEVSPEFTSHLNAVAKADPSFKWD